MVTSRSPLKNFWQAPRIEFVALDFLKPVDTLIPKMQTFCRGVTHTFFTSYVHTDDFTKLGDLNVPLFEHFLIAIDTVAGDSLQRVCLQTGGKVFSQRSKLVARVVIDVHSTTAVTWVRWRFPYMKGWNVMRIMD